MEAEIARASCVNELEKSRERDKTGNAGVLES